MSTKDEYWVMGDDGHEYGPVSARQVREWIGENRLERKTPVKTSQTRDWVFLEMLPEFAETLRTVVPLKPENRPARKWRWVLLLLVLALILLLALKQYQPLLQTLLNHV
jgi:hypothetical protein